MKIKIKIKKGFTIIAAVFVVLVVTLLAIATSTFISSDAMIAVKNYHSLDAFYIASAGIEYYMNLLADDMDWSTPPTRETKVFSGGTFTISTTYETKNRLTLTSTGLVTVGATTYRRAIQAALRRGGLPSSFDYGGFVANPGGKTLHIRNGAHIEGDFYYYGPVIMYDGTDQTDGVMYSTSIETYNMATYASWEVAPETELPEWDNSAYDDILSATASVAAGPLIKDTATTWNLGGGTYYYTEITISKGIVNGPGTLVATANPSGSGDINVIDTGNIGNNVTLIAKGNVNFGNATTFGASMEVYTYGTITDSNGRDLSENSLLYSRSSGEAIALGDNSVLGSYVVMLAPYGRISGGSNSEVKGLIYSSTFEVTGNFRLFGAVVCYESGDFRDQSWIEYSPGYLSPHVEGFATTTYEVTSWTEVY